MSAYMPAISIIGDGIRAFSSPGIITGQWREISALAPGLVRQGEGIAHLAV